MGVIVVKVFDKTVRGVADWSELLLFALRPTLRAHICPSYKITELFGVQKWGNAQLYKVEGLDFTAVMASLREYLLIAGISGLVGRFWGF